MLGKGGCAFTFYLAGQGISNLGDSFRFIAVTILIFKLTGSGLEAASGLAMSLIPSILLSPFAGVLGDRIDERRLLVLLDFVRFPAVLLFLCVNNVMQIYFLLILLSLFDIFYNPSRRKFILGMTGKKGALRANSLLTGIAGIAYLAGPLSAGLMTDAFGIAPAIAVASICCLFTSFLTFTAGVVYRRTVPSEKHAKSNRTEGCCIGRKSKHNVLKELGRGFRYCMSVPDVKALLIIGLITGFCTLSINLSFYPYAFDILKVTAKGWSLMVTIYYGTNLVAVLLLKYLEGYFKGRDGRLFYGGLCIVSVIWVFYAAVTNYANVLLLQFLEGTVIAVCGILLSARFQSITQKGFMARVTGISDIFSNIGKLAGIGCTAVLAGRLPFGTVFILNGTLLFLFAVSGFLGSRWSKGIPDTPKRTGIL